LGDSVTKLAAGWLLWIALACALAACGGPTGGEELHPHFYAPTRMAIQPYADVEGGPLLYVLNSFGGNLSIMQSDGYKVLKGYHRNPFDKHTIWTGPAPYDIAITPDGAMLYITDAGDEAVRLMLPDDPWPVTATTLTLRAARLSITPFANDPKTFQPSYPASWAERPEVWFTDPDGERLVVWDHAATAEAGEVALPSAPVDLRVSRDGETVYVTCEDATVRRVTAASRRLDGEAIALGGKPERIVENLEQTELYVLNIDPPQLHVIDLALWRATEDLISFPAALNDMAMSTDGKLGFITSDDGYLYYYYPDDHRACGSSYDPPTFFDRGPLSNPELTEIQTADCVTQKEVWTIAYDQDEDYWKVEGTKSGPQASVAYTDQAYAADHAQLKFIIRSADRHPSDGDFFRLQTRVWQEPIPVGSLPDGVVVTPLDDDPYGDKIFVADAGAEMVTRLLTADAENQNPLQ
jgi:DNA-binding beta-propeller fold protein YncE